MGIWCVQGRYQCDPHQQWADEGWGEGVYQRHACNERCDYFRANDLDPSTGLCLRDSRITHHGGSVKADLAWVEYQEDDRAGDCVW